MAHLSWFAYQAYLGKMVFEFSIAMLDYQRVNPDVQTNYISDTPLSFLPASTWLKV